MPIFVSCPQPTTIRLFDTKPKPFGCAHVAVTFNHCFHPLRLTPTPHPNTRAIADTQLDTHHPRASCHMRHESNTALAPHRVPALLGRAVHRTAALLWGKCRLASSVLMSVKFRLVILIMCAMIGRKGITLQSDCGAVLALLSVALARFFQIAAECHNEGRMFKQKHNPMRPTFFIAVFRHAT